MPAINIIYIGIGFFIYAIGASAMVLAYRYGELSVLQPINSTSYVFSLIIGKILFNEKIVLLHIAAVLFILTGVIIIGTSKE
jgi:undecaprenyl phosphate-alpha-L-ara4N flippase subunit ArnE